MLRPTALIVVLWFISISATHVSAQIAACCLGNGSCVDTNQAGCDTLSGELLPGGSDCGSANCNGACCSPDDSCIVGSADDCVTGEFQGVGSACATHCGGKLGTAFTYQGQLRKDGTPLSGVIDLEASLWTATVGGEQVGDPGLVDKWGTPDDIYGDLRLPNISVVNGLFTADLDFGAVAFSGN
jgi:hypothetical protein